MLHRSSMQLLKSVNGLNGHAHGAKRGKVEFSEHR
jgi:hypothetical protein